MDNYLVNRMCRKSYD